MQQALVQTVQNQAPRHKYEDRRLEITWFAFGIRIYIQVFFSTQVFKSRKKRVIEMIQRLCWAKLNGWLLCFWGFIVFDWRFFFSEVSEVRLRQIFDRISQSSVWSVRFQSSSESFYFGKKKHVPMWLVPVIVAYSWLHDFNNIDSLHHCHHIWNGGNGAPRQERCPSGHLARWVSWVPWRYFFGPQAGFPMGSMDLMGNA